MLAPWADVLYACDSEWWRRYGAKIDFDGLRLAGDKSSLKHHPDLHHLRIEQTADQIYTLRPGTVGWGGNSGFHALNLAVQLGPQRILLVGFDMRIDLGRHWHPDHPKGMNNPEARNVARWRKVMDAAAASIAARGIEVINCSAESALQNYRKCSFQEATGC